MIIYMANVWVNQTSLNKGTRHLAPIDITEAQAGGQKGKSTTDHLLILKNSINKIRSNHKPAYT